MPLAAKTALSDRLARPYIAGIGAGEDDGTSFGETPT
jgi:hypothetical protein